ncbi:MAG: hypothetical protein FWC59_01435 [Actinomycetia bacterium]|nr:hypothetical protein [Actinomycetes bacterium]
MTRLLDKTNEYSAKETLLLLISPVVVIYGSLGVLGVVFGYIDVFNPPPGVSIDLPMPMILLTFLISILINSLPIIIGILAFLYARRADRPGLIVLLCLLSTALAVATWLSNLIAFAGVAGNSIIEIMGQFPQLTISLIPVITTNALVFILALLVKRDYMRAAKVAGSHVAPDNVNSGAATDNAPSCACNEPH